MEWMILPLKRYADFSGRSRRKEYWMFALFVTLIYFILAFVFGGFAAFSGDEGGGSMGIGGILLILFWLAILIPSIAVGVRRFHDQDKSGWMLLLSFIPLVGGLIVFIFMLLEGTRGPNRYGPDPKAEEPHTGL